MDEKYLRFIIRLHRTRLAGRSLRAEISTRRIKIEQLEEEIRSIEITLDTHQDNLKRILAEAEAREEIE